MKTIVLIPAYQPDEKLVSLVQALISENLSDIVVVNDGSNENCASIFKKISKLSGVVVINHSHNQGKGAALKTGFQYCQSREKESSYVVITVDADGQHIVSDIKKLANAALLQLQPIFILGVRNFECVPLRSKFGNTLTRWVFKKLFGKKLTDTQTGLRVISSDLVSKFLVLRSGCYEFETDCLVCAIKSGIDIQQIEIQTIYIDSNRSSHFRPIRDSLRIYFLFFRFIFR